MRQSEKLAALVIICCVTVGMLYQLKITEKRTEDFGTPLRAFETCMIFLKKGNLESFYSCFTEEGKNHVSGGGRLAKERVKKLSGKYKSLFGEFGEINLESYKFSIVDGHPRIVGMMNSVRRGVRIKESFEMFLSETKDGWKFERFDAKIVGRELIPSSSAPE